MNVLAPVTPRTFSLDELRQLSYLPDDFWVPITVEMLSISERTALEKAVTMLVPSTNRDAYRAQRVLFQAIMEVPEAHPNLRAYCEAVTTLSTEEWDIFGRVYQVPPGGGERLARAHTTYANLFPPQY